MPHRYLAQAIKKVDAMPDLRARLVNGVHGSFQQYNNVNSEVFCENLAQLVLRNADDIGPGSFQALFWWWLLLT